MFAIITIFLLLNPFFLSNSIFDVFYASIVFAITIVQFFFIFSRRVIVFKKSINEKLKVFEKNDDFTKLFHIRQIDSSFESKNKFFEIIFEFIFLIKFFIKLNMIMISIVIYHFFSKRYHKNKNYDFFFMFLYNINKILNYIEFRINIEFMFKKKLYSKNYVKKS